MTECYHSLFLKQEEELEMVRSQTSVKVSVILARMLFRYSSV